MQGLLQYRFFYTVISSVCICIEKRLQKNSVSYWKLLTFFSHNRMKEQHTRVTDYQGNMADFITLRPLRNLTLAESLSFIRLKDQGETQSLNLFYTECPCWKSWTTVKPEDYSREGTSKTGAKSASRSRRKVAYYKLPRKRQQQGRWSPETQRQPQISPVYSETQGWAPPFGSE